MIEKLIFSLIFIFGTFISSVSQIILKKSANKNYPNKIREYLNIRVISAYGIFFAATLCTIIAYAKIPLSFGPILEATGYIFVAVLSFIFLKEKITLKKKIGLVVIIIGVVIFAL